MSLIDFKQIKNGERLINSVNSHILEDNTRHSEITSTIQQLSDRVAGCEAISTSVEDTFNIVSSEPTTTFVLSQTPNANDVEMVINSMVYSEGEDFTVNRTTKTATWTLTAANDGFDITSPMFSSVLFRYKTGNLVNNTTTTTVLHQDSLPESGTYKAGDTIYKINMVPGECMGWVCTEGGSPGTWVEMGIVNFSQTIVPIDDSEESGSESGGESNNESGNE